MERLNTIREKVLEFRDARDWQKFHSPKNLSMAICGEAGELLEHFQWVSEEESFCFSTDKLEAVSDEIADIQIYLLLIAEQIGIDVLSVTESKLRKNALKYPIEKSLGNATKYTDL